MTFRAPNHRRVRDGDLASDDGFGNNGAFLIPGPRGQLFVIASDGEGWEHVSVTRVRGKRGLTPAWDEMCAVKAAFWDPEDCVIQFHPPESEYVNDHPGCLHLWRAINQEQPRPPAILVGLGIASL